jgi:hypothetical protein
MIRNERLRWVELLPDARFPSDSALRPAHHLKINAAFAQSPEQTADDGLRSSPRPGLCGVSYVD